jgi:hypothetical protein
VQPRAAGAGTARGDVGVGFATVQAFPALASQLLIDLDLGGTLTDPYDGITRSVSYALEQMDLPCLSKQQLRASVGPPLQDTFAVLSMGEARVARAVAQTTSSLRRRSW